MDLRDHLFNLPQELFDRICNLTFAVDTTTTVVVHKGWKPPVQLQISRATRDDFAHEYYSSPAGFRLDYRQYQELVESWLLVLPFQHRLQLKRTELRVHDQSPFGRYSKRSPEDVGNILVQFYQVFYLLGIQFVWRPGVHVLHIDFDDKSTKMWLLLESPVIKQLPG